MFQIEEELKKLPGKPGVYIMHGEKDEIIYVGKAVSLKNRVRQYFQSSRNKGAKIEQMVTHITRFEYIITDSELEALVLECNLIKEHRPKYNTMLKDDKSYPFIKVTVNEEYPRVLFARRMKKDKAKYFGPYTSAGAVKDVIELVRKLYKVRSCNRVLPRDCGKDRPCLYYHMKQCSAPCQGYVSSEEYKKNIAELLKFLNGDFKDTIDMPRTMGALGYVMQVPEEEKYLNTKKELEAMLVGYLGGRAAEELVFDTVTTGAANDIEQATKVARAMITQYGMSDKFGLMGLATQENQYLSGRAVLNCGDDTATEVDHEVMVLLHNSYEEAKRLIGSHREALDKIATYLIRRETITGKEFMKIFHAVERGIEIPENLDDLVIPEEKQNTVTLDKPEIQ